VPIGTLVKTGMPRRIFTGLLARGTLGRAVLDHQDLMNGDQICLVLFNRTTHDVPACFRCHARDSFLFQYQRALSYRVGPTCIISQNREPGCVTLRRTESGCGKMANPREGLSLPDRSNSFLLR
jgi:hypothetical protein